MRLKAHISRLHPSSALFLAPLALCFSWGDIGAYRSAQAAATILMAAFVVTNYRRRHAPISVVAWTLIITLWVPYILVLIRDGGQVDHQIASILKLSIFTAILLAFDLSRQTGFQPAMKQAAPIAAIVVVLSAFQILMLPQTVWGRHLYFGLHPNWGGEILFAASAALMVVKNNWLRWAAAGATLFVLISLQSRAAMLGFVMIWGGAELLHGTIGKRLRRAILLGAPIAGIAVLTVLASPSLTAMIVEFISSDALLLDDPNRGLGTGFVGRIDSLRAFGDAIAQRPILGAGLDQAVWAGGGWGIHSGYLAVAAEYGLASAPIWIVLTFALVRSFSRDRYLFIVLLASAFVFFFNARTINLNVFPMILWISMLPWSAPPRNHPSTLGG